jgi:hypothetical protein
VLTIFYAAFVSMKMGGGGGCGECTGTNTAGGETETACTRAGIRKTHSAYYDEVRHEIKHRLPTVLLRLLSLTCGMFIIKLY